MTNSEDEHLLESKSVGYGSTEPPCEASKQSGEEQESQTAEKSYVCLGYIFCIISGFCLIGSDVSVKFAINDAGVSSWQMLFICELVQLVVIIPILCWTKVNIFGPPDVKTRLRLVAIAALAGTMLLCIFQGIGRLPLGDYSAIKFSSPAFTMVLSIFMLKDRCGILRVLIGLSLTVGVVIISRPTALFPNESAPSIANISSTEQDVKTSLDPIGIVFTLSGALLSALVTIFVRQVSHVHFSVQMLWFSTGGLIVALAGMLLIDTDPLFTTWTTTAWLLSINQGILSLLGSVLILRALRWISPTQNKVIRSFQIVVSYIIQVEAFGTVPHMLDYVGALMIVLSVLGIVLEDKIVKIVKFRYF